MRFPGNDFLMRLINTILALGVLAARVVGQASMAPSPITYPEFGFRYTPPGNLRDFTAFDKESVQQRAAALRATKVLTVVLSLQAASDDNSPDWNKIGIESYPREKLAGLSDRAAIAKMSIWVAGVGTAAGVPKEANIGGFHFTVSAFELREGQLVRHANIYTTILKGQVVSFAFTANSLDVLSQIERSINSIEPLAPR